MSNKYFIIMSAVKLPFGAEGFLFKEIFKSNGKICFICHDNDAVNTLAKNVRFFLNDIKVFEFPEWDTVPYDRISPSRDLVQRRIKTLKGISESSEYIVFCTVKSFNQKVLDNSFIKKSIKSLKEGDKIDFQELIKTLTGYGYSRVVNAEYIGELAVRGSIIDIVVGEKDEGVRLDFFGDRLESIRTYDTESQRSQKRLNHINILPMTEVLVDGECVNNFLKNYRNRFGLEKISLIEAVKYGHKFNGIENWQPLFYDDENSFKSLLGSDCLVYAPESYEQEIEEFKNFIYERYELRSDRFKENISFIEPNELFDFSHYDCSYYSRLNLAESAFKGIDNFYTKSQAEDKYSIDLLKEYLVNDPKRKNLICLSSRGTFERVKKLLDDHEISFNICSNFEGVKPGLNIVDLDIINGFSIKDYCFISEYELFGRRSEKKSRIKSKKGKDVFGDISTLDIGELIVHIEHGIGKFQGLNKIKVSGKDHDFVEIHYADGDIFYLPVENLDLLTRYGEGSEGKLDKLGSVGWQTRKAGLKKRIKEFSEKLLKIAAQRHLKTADKLDYDREFYNHFSDRFPYTETEDQERCIEECLEDFGSGKPMDRLICGDVGFGKTEVALRAACAVVGSKDFKQVAVLVPTTLLARQHYKTFMERFAGTPVRISQMSKFATRSEIIRAKKNLKEGALDIIIATHSLLAKDVSFKNLGLLIIDEEQHFGVSQKERLKELKKDCHVLTLSATPIPRTLQMSLLGIRDLSVMATPPVNRFPVRTSVIPYDVLTLREAILRETSRGGRTFYVTPRIAYLNGIVDALKEFVPEVKVAKAHGQMTSTELDRIMNDFYDGKYNVLVSTNIVESGLDIPFANTMIIDRADMYGMSQLYQMRGRVGRSNVQAYAYLTYPTGKKLTGVADKRLSLLSSLDSLGSGFTLASHDMDIRGYGNLVGDEQSGHIKEVGVELYQSMLKDAIEALKNDEEQQDIEWSPTINIGLSVQIPESYIPDISLRVHLYRQIANITDEENLEQFAEEMIDKYGKLPNSVEHLFDIVRIKNLAKKAGVEKVDLGEKALMISFKEGVKINMPAIVDFIGNSASKIKIRSDNKLLVFIEDKRGDKILKKISELLIAISI